MSGSASPGSDKSGRPSGKVWLVGAGPGDPGLITVRGKELLELADTVVYDALCNPRLLQHALKAEHIYVGKRAARHTLTQDRINQLLVELAMSGKKVVRLKGGDPFVFGRGGEECAVLAAAGVPFEVVPGITAAIAAPAYAGIPVTHRDLNSTFTLVTGHEKEEVYQDPAAREREAAGGGDVDWSALAGLPCLAFYMGLKSLRRICAKLVEHGMDPKMPAAAIHRGTTAAQRTVTGTLATLADEVAGAGLGPPVMTIVGRVVELRATMNWFESRPLFGQTIVVTRTRQQASELSRQLEELGAEVLEAPTIELADPEDWGPVDAAVAAGGEYDWIIFTSVNGVQAARDRLDALGKDARIWREAKIAAIGRATADAIRARLGLKVDLCPERSVAESLADELAARGVIRGGRFLLLRAEIARPVLMEGLKSGGAVRVDDIPIYRTLPARSLQAEVLAAIADQRVDWITFTSSSTARNFTALLGPEYAMKMANIKLASIGPVTSRTMAELGLTPAIEAGQADIAGLVKALARGA